MNILYTTISLGLECTSRLRKLEIEQLQLDPNYRTQRIIVSSANADDVTSQLAFDAGVNGFLEKPLKLQDVYDLYADILSTEEFSLKDSIAKGNIMKENIMKIEYKDNSSSAKDAIEESSLSF